VHSLKDVPMVLEPGFALPAILARADHADAFVSNRFATSTRCRRARWSAPRRCAARRSCARGVRTCVLRDLRGNVNTRLAKLDAGEYDAIVLACAGLHALGFDARIRARLMRPRWLPAPAQGAIAIECRDDDAATHELCARARRRRHAHVCRGRARHEPRAARQLPRAGGRVRAPRRHAAAPAGPGRIGERRPRRARRPRRPDPEALGSQSPSACSRKAPATDRRDAQ
jgi:hydroxymethylbilane synthase